VSREQQGAGQFLRTSPHLLDWLTDGIALPPCRDRVTALQISADGRWLLSSAMDGTVRVWDVPAAQCMQVGGRAGGRTGLWACALPCSALLLRGVVPALLWGCAPIRMAVQGEGA
jgi:hypothetical protein